jgi:NAD(P)H dehydrogenase (quinone)
MAAKIAVIYHSRNGTIHRLAGAAAEGAADVGATVRLLRVRDDAALPPPAAAGTGQPVAEASLDDLLWADGLVLGTPTYYGNVSAPLKRFIDSTSALWKRGLLSGRPVTGLTSSTCTHGGREATLLALYHSMYHWGALIVPSGQAGPAARLNAELGGNPYGLSVPARPDGAVTDLGLAGARLLGQRVCDVAGRLGSPAPKTAAAAARRVKVAVIWHAADRATTALALALARGARTRRAVVRLRRVAELSPVGHGVKQPGLPMETAAMSQVPVATPTDLAWADGIVLGAPARTGMVTPQLGYFIETAEPLRALGRLAGKTATAFITTRYTHAGSESALLALYQVMHHWGAVIVPPGYTDPAIFDAGGNPYGTSYATSAGPEPNQATLAAAEYQGARLALIAAQLHGCMPGPAGAGRKVCLAAAPGA